MDSTTEDTIVNNENTSSGTNTAPQGAPEIISDKVPQDAPNNAPEQTPEPPRGIPQEWANYSTGDNVLDASIASTLTTMGSNPEEFLKIVGNAVAYQDLNLIDTTTLQQKYPQYADVIKAYAGAMIAQNAKQAQQVQDIAYSVASGKDNWTRAVSIFNAKAPDYLKETVKSMIDNGYVKEGATMLMQTVGNLGSSSNTMPAFTGNTSTYQGISYAQMKKELDNLITEAGGASLESGEYGERYKALMHQRAIGRRMGL